MEIGPGKSCGRSVIWVPPPLQMGRALPAPWADENLCPRPPGLSSLTGDSASGWDNPYPLQATNHETLDQSCVLGGPMSLLFLHLSHGWWVLFVHFGQA